MNSNCVIIPDKQLILSRGLKLHTSCLHCSFPFNSESTKFTNKRDSNGTDTQEVWQYLN